MTWQPIETAPKDGTAILVCGGQDSKWDEFSWDGPDSPLADNPLIANVNGPRVVWWEGWYVDDVEKGRWCVAYYDSAVVSVGYENPTYWMPILEPPS